MLSILHWIDVYFQLGGWVPIWVFDWYLALFHSERIRRGKHRRWAERRFPPLGVVFIYLVLVSTGLAAWLALDTPWVAHFFWIYLFVSDVYDFITGSEDPPWRRWATSLSERIKLVIQPPPRPAIDLGGAR